MKYFGIVKTQQASRYLWTKRWIKGGKNQKSKQIQLLLFNDAFDEFTIISISQDDYWDEDRDEDGWDEDEDGNFVVKWGRNDKLVENFYENPIYTYLPW